MTQTLITIIPICSKFTATQRVDEDNNAAFFNVVTGHHDWKKWEMSYMPFNTQILRGKKSVSHTDTQNNPRGAGLNTHKCDILFLFIFLYSWDSNFFNLCDSNLNNNPNFNGLAVSPWTVSNVHTFSCVCWNRHDFWEEGYVSAANCVVCVLFFLWHKKNGDGWN